MPYRVVEYDSDPTGMPGMEVLINEWAAKGYSFHQAVRESNRWVLFLSSNEFTSCS
ncbi:hypothetical protein [Sinorhizobium meliloti]|uniref:hypothetical protein n=1 Tax=Rhizobium meliloti TaxID=382 RepID=UPI0013E36238|nr:hypothetical protein [Sinorhizobium meliloti]MDE4618675.1 hypothetical protein [Sinorhizobium meliloti]WQP15642.1 hypothetical protein U8C30_34610 [Sinorhizobium meliloti]WQP29130.1 hypothetical protein U8C43_34560 [Sinorhizobium meliloti]